MLVASIVHFDVQRYQLTALEIIFWQNVCVSLTQLMAVPGVTKGNKAQQIILTSPTSYFHNVNSALQF